MSENSDRNSYRLATSTAVVAGALALCICTLLLYDYSRRLAKDPLDSATYKTLVAALDAQPTSETLKEEIRTLDLELRREYFRQRRFVQVGAGLLLASLAIFLAAAKTAVTARRRLPLPGGQVASQDAEVAWTQAARWGVGAVSLVLVSIAVALAVTVRSPLEEDRVKLAAMLDKPVGGDHGRQSSPEIVDNRRVDAQAAEGLAPPSKDAWRQMWPRFRGPDGSGVSAYTNVPDSWNVASGKGIVWKTAVPLPGNNSPVVWGKRVFLSGADQRRREVYCFDADSGKLLWRQPAPGTPQSMAQPPKVNDETGYAAPTTTTDGRRVFAIFANGDVAAFDFAGKLAWSKSLGIPENTYGHASSLAMCGNLLLVQLDQGIASSGKSKLLAFDAASGKVAWQVGRPVANSWTSPIVVSYAGREQIITASDPWVISYNAADGAEIWRAKCLQTDIGPSPTFADGKVFVGGESSDLSAIRADGRGDVTGSHIVWKGQDDVPDTCSPLATKEFVLVLTSYGILTCYDAAKGDKLWSEDFSGDFTASPSLVGKRVYLIGTSGKVWIVEPTRNQCKRLSEADLGEGCVTSPAFQEGRIYLRGKDHLFCIGT